MKLLLSKQASKFLDKLSEPLRGRFDKTLLKLEKDPFPNGAKKLVGTVDINLFRVRVGDYRIIYRVSKDALYIDEIDHRKDIYRH